MDESRKMIVEYEDFCRKPEKYYKKLVEKMDGLGCRIAPDYLGEESFTVTNREPKEEIKKYYEEYMNVAR